MGKAIESQRDERKGDAARRNESRNAPEQSSRPAGLTGTRAAQLAQAHVQELTGQPCESVSGLSRHQQGWTVMVEVVEMERVPRTTDILASYRVDVDQQGELMGYERVSRYYRNQAGGGE